MAYLNNQENIDTIVRGLLVDLEDKQKLLEKQEDEGKNTKHTRKRIKDLEDILGGSLEEIEVPETPKLRFLPDTPVLEVTQPKRARVREKPTVIVTENTSYLYLAQKMAKVGNDEMLEISKQIVIKDKDNGDKYITKREWELLNGVVARYSKEMALISKEMQEVADSRYHVHLKQVPKTKDMLSFGKNKRKRK